MLSNPYHALHVVHRSCVLFPTRNSVVSLPIIDQLTLVDGQAEVLGGNGHEDNKSTFPNEKYNNPKYKLKHNIYIYRYKKDFNRKVRI